MLHYGSLPVLDMNGTVIAQSNAILRYIGKQTNLYPNDPIEALKVDELLEALEDVNKLIGKIWREQGKKKKKRK
jgi:prostaglandin-H2 D-isomerase / glutathione transferase